MWDLNLGAQPLSLLEFERRWLKPLGYHVRLLKKVKLIYLFLDKNLFKDTLRPSSLLKVKIWYKCTVQTTYHFHRESLFVQIFGILQHSNEKTCLVQLKYFSHKNKSNSHLNGSCFVPSKLLWLKNSDSRPLNCSNLNNFNIKNKFEIYKIL